MVLENILGNDEKITFNGGDFFQFATFVLVDELKNNIKC